MEKERDRDRKTISTMYEKVDVVKKTFLLKNWGFNRKRGFKRFGSGAHQRYGPGRQTRCLGRPMRRRETARI